VAKSSNGSDLVVREEQFIMLTPESREDMQALVMENLGPDGFTAFDLELIKIPTGGFYTVTQGCGG